ncbi:MAG: hypothetical protein GT597_13970 [Bacteroidales bacterium]|nr:hypothetical protein [Bacteroidales bacterium]MZQ48937.1 hypothetical protein [Bacteroidales bacterium]
MIDDYVLPDVSLREVSAVKTVVNPDFTSGNWQVNQNEYSARVDGVADFYVRDGNYVEFVPDAGANQGWIRLYLRGQVLVALLHQRRILNFHASSFVHDGKGIMVLGDAGTGKSSITASFIIKGAGFLTDDITPVIFRDGDPLIWPIYSDIRLRDSTVEQLQISPDRLSSGEVWTGKHHLRIEGTTAENFPLHMILKIDIGECSSPEFHEPSSADKFSLLRSEICSWEMLAGMAETEAAYLQQLVKIVEQVHIVRVVRPPEISIMQLHEALKGFLKQI